jgi:hypothetical protein
LEVDLFVLEVGESVLAKSMKGLDHRLAGLQAAVVCEAVGCGLDGVEVLGYAPRCSAWSRSMAGLVSRSPEKKSASSALWWRCTKLQ